MIARETVEKYKYPSFAIETAFEYKYQIAMETAEQNTSIRLQWKLRSRIQVSDCNGNCGAEYKYTSQCKGNCTPECVQILKNKNFFFFFF